MASNMVRMEVDQVSSLL